MGCYSKNAMDWVAGTTNIFFSRLWRVEVKIKGASRLGVQRQLRPGLWTTVLRLHPHVVEGVGGAPWSSPCKGILHTLESKSLVASQRAHLLKPPHGASGSGTETPRGDRDTRSVVIIVHQCGS